MKKQLIYDYKATFGTEAGKRVIEDLKKRCQLLTDGINVSNGVDPNKALVLLGEHRLMMHILKTIGTDPYAEVQKEAVSERKENYARG